MDIKRFGEGDILVMKKQHPCKAEGSERMRVIRIGSDIKVACCGCGREMIIPRQKLEKNIKVTEK